MKKRRDEILNMAGLDKKCKEEQLELKIKACQQVYDEFKDKIYNFAPDIEQTQAK